PLRDHRRGSVHGRRDLHARLPGGVRGPGAPRGGQMTHPPVMSLRGITHSFGAVRALVDVDLDVHAHEVVAVVGDNGAGKSTLVAVLAGALVPDAGEVVVDGQEVLLRSPGLARPLGVATVFQ